MTTKYEEINAEYLQNMLTKEGGFVPDEIHHALAEAVVAGIAATVSGIEHNDVMFAFSMLSFNKILAEKVEKVLGIDVE